LTKEGEGVREKGWEQESVGEERNEAMSDMKKANIKTQ
jgi:hypothetical protein